MLRFAGSLLVAASLSACGSSQGSPAPEPIANRAPAAAASRAETAAARSSDEASAGLSQEAIEGVIRRTLPTVRRCYQELLVVEPSLEGEVEVAFGIAPDGATVDAMVVEGLGESLDRCVLFAVLGMKFPERDGGEVLIVRYPYRFTQNDAATDAGAPTP